MNTFKTVTAHFGSFKLPGQIGTPAPPSSTAGQDQEHGRGLVVLLSRLVHLDVERGHFRGIAGASSLMP